MKEFTRDNLKSLRSDIDKALAEIHKKHGVMLSIGNIRFGTDNFTTRMTGIIAGKTATDDVSAKEAIAKKALDDYGIKYGLNPSLYNKSFTIPGHTGMYRLIGLKPSSPKNIVLFEKIGGNQYHCSILYAKRFKFETR